MTEFIIMAVVLGLAAGFAPGPLLVLAVSETVKGRFRNGLLVAVAPLITDLPIVALSILLISKISGNEVLLGTIYILGGLFLSWLALGDIRSHRLGSGDTHPGSSLKKGIIANFLNPQPYIWWMGIGAPIVLDAWRTQPRFAIAFVLAFYGCLVGSKIAIALITHSFRGFMKSAVYVWVLRILGMVLFVFAVVFIFKGIDMMQLF